MCSTAWLGGPGGAGRLGRPGSRQPEFGVEGARCSGLDLGAVALADKRKGLLETPQTTAAISPIRSAVFTVRAG